MTELQLIHVRPGKAREVFGICPATICTWSGKDAIRICKRGHLSFIKVDEVAAYIVQMADHPVDQKA